MPIASGGLLVQNIRKVIVMRLWKNTLKNITEWLVIGVHLLIFVVLGCATIVAVCGSVLILGSGWN